MAGDVGDAEGQSRGAAPHSGDWVGDWVWAATERSGSGRGERQAAVGEGERGIGLLLGFGLGRYDLRGE